MTNFEKHKEDLMKIKGDFAVDKNTKEIAVCDIFEVEGIEKCIDCVDCIFYEGDCLDSDKIKWLYEEYEEPILSDDELDFISILNKINKKEYKYIYKSGNRVVFCDKPNIDKCGTILDKSNYLEISGYTDLFSNIKSEHGLYDVKNKCFI